MSVVNAYDQESTMQKQNKRFEELEPDRFIRVIKMAAEIKRITNEKYQAESLKRTKTEEGVGKDVIWRHHG